METRAHHTPHLSRGCQQKGQMAQHGRDTPLQGWGGGSWQQLPVAEHQELRMLQQLLLL